MPDPRPPRRASVLVTGAAGNLGALLSRALSPDYSLSLLDRRPLSGSTRLPFSRIDLAAKPDLGDCLRGTDAVVHLAGIPHAQASWEALIEANAVATENLLREAYRNGCPLVILASSVQVMDGYPPGTDILPDLPVWPVNPYAASKACAEAAADRLSRRTGLSVLCLRLGWVLPRFDWRITPRSPHLERVLTEADFVRLIRAALGRALGAGFEIHHGLSDNRRKRLNIDSARTALGYEPRDDAFALARTNLPGMVRAAAIGLRKRSGMRRGSAHASG
jgi:uronate dehydrogenase